MYSYETTISFGRDFQRLIFTSGQVSDKRPIVKRDPKCVLKMAMNYTPLSYRKRRSYCYSYRRYWFFFLTSSCGICAQTTSNFLNGHVTMIFWNITHFVIRNGFSLLFALATGFCFQKITLFLQKSQKRKRLENMVFNVFIPTSY